MRRLAPLAILLVVACSGGGPEFLGGDGDLFFQGAIAPDETRSEHPFELTSSGTIEVMLETVTATAVETGEPIEDPQLSVAIGRPDIEGGCVPRRVATLAAGESFILFLTPSSFCLRVERTLQLSASGESSVEYVLSISPALG